MFVEFVDLRNSLFPTTEKIRKQDARSWFGRKGDAGRGGG